jgi:hypothetical protein
MRSSAGGPSVNVAERIAPGQIDDLVAAADIEAVDPVRPDG